MKKILTAGLLAAGILCLSQQRASAWVNCKFGVGLNWQHQSGGNSVAWGLLRGGQPPEQSPYYGAPGFEGAPQGFGGGQGFGAMYGSPVGADMPVAAAPTPAPAAAQPAQAPAPNRAYYYQQPNYQTVTYPGFYTMPNYYYPATFYYYGR